MKQARRMISVFLVCTTLLGSAAVYPQETEAGYTACEDADVQVQAENDLASTVKNGLIVHLKLDGSVTDETGSGTPQLVGEATYETGISGQAIRFSGERGKTNGNRIKLAERSDLQFGAQDAYSAGFWFKAKSAVADSNLMGTKSWNKASNPGWCLAVNNADNGRFRFAPVGGTGPEFVYRAASGDKWFDNSQWVYLVVTRSATGNGKMYLNGKQVSAPSGNVTSSADSGVQEGDFCIGADFLGQYGPGNLIAFDDVRIWNRVLSDEEIAYLYATTPSLSKVTITGESRVDISNGTEQKVTLSVKGTQANGETTPQDAVTWSSDTEGVTAEPQGNGATAVITVSPNVSPQTVQITATCRGVSGTAQLEVVKDTAAETVTITGKRAVLKKASEIREIYGAEFRNRYGTVLTNVQDLAWSVDSTEGVTVSDNGDGKTATVVIPDDAESESVYTVQVQGAGLTESVRARLVTKGVVPANLVGKVENKFSFDETYDVDEGGNVTPTVSGTLTYADGVQGKAALFTSGNYVDFGNYDLAGKTITMAFQSRDFTGVQDPAILANKDWNQANEKGFLFAYCYNQTEKFRSRVGSGSANETVTWDYRAGQWMTLAFVFEQDAYSIYTDGQLVERCVLTDWTQNWMNSDKYSLKLGNDGTGSYQFNSSANSEYHFLADNFTIYNSVLNQNELEEIAVVNTTEEVSETVVIHPLADVLDIDFDDGTVCDRSRYETEFVQAAEAVVERDATLQRNVLALSGTQGTDVKYKVSAAQTDAISQTFTFETAFSVNEKKNQAIAGNTEVGGMSYEMNADGRVELWVRSEQANGYFEADGAKPGFDAEVGTYYHAVTTYDGSRLKLYVNGKEVYNRAADFTVKHPSSADKVAFSIGADPKKNYADSALPMNGKVARVGLYSTALTKKQVQEIYREFVTPEQAEVNAIQIAGENTVAANLGTVHTYTLDFLAQNGKYVRRTDRNNITWTLENAPSGVSMQGNATETEVVQVKVDTKTADGTTFVLKATYAGSTPTIAASKTVRVTNDGTGENIKIAVLSDFQLKSSTSSTVTDNIKKALKNYKEKGVDVILIPGDMTDDASTAGYEKMWAAFDAVWPDKATRPPIISCMGNHDYWNGRFQGKANDLEAAQALYLAQMGAEGLNTHKVVKGYHFISISPEDDSTHGLFTEASVNFLKNAVAEAERDDPTKPIFVQAHQHVRKKTETGETPTVYLSDEWGNAALYDAMKDHPQIVFFSGHSHAPIDDERSIHQEDFTSIGTSSVNYLELESGKVGGTKPTGYNTRAQSLYLSVTADKITVERWDKGVKMGSRADWVINRPIAKNDFTYTNEARNATRTAPTFAENAKITVSDLTENTVKITFPAATHDDFVHSYRVEIKNKSNADVKDVNYLYFSDFCKGVPNMADSVSYSLSALTCGTDYDINVYAIESFGKESKPLHTTIQTVQGTIDPNDPKPTADVLNVNFISGTAVDTSPFATTLTAAKQENATAVSYSVDDTVHHMVLHCNNSALKAALSSAQLAKITNQYSMETVVKLQRTDVAQSVFANTESAGISLEITDTGRIEMWARIGNAYQKAGESENYLLQAGQYYHLMGTYDGTRMTLYVNGQKVATKEAVGTVTHKDLPMYIGGDTNTNGDLQAPMSGEIALARLYSIGLSEQQVVNLYRAYDDIASGVYPTKAVITGADCVFAAGTEAVRTADFSVSFQDDEGHPVTVTDTENIVWSLRAAGQGVSIPQDSTGETVRLSVAREAEEQKAVLAAEYALPDATTRKITAQKEISIEAKKAVPVEVKISGEDVVRVENGTQTRQYSATAFDGDGQPIDNAEFTWTLISAANGVGLSAAGMLYVNDTAETGEAVIEAVLASDATMKARKTISIVAQTVTQTGGGGGRGTHSAAASNIGAIVEKLPNDSAATESVNAEIGFRDVPQTHWAREWIQKLVAMDIIAGDAEGTLRPDENITREETVKVLLKALHEEVTETEGEVDENTSDWAKSYVLYAKKSGIVMGDENGAFHGRNEVSRVDAMVMIARALALTDGSPQTLKVFADCAKIPNYAVPCVAKLVEIGAVEGYEDGSIGADKKMTRAELFTLIARMLG